MSQKSGLYEAILAAGSQAKLADLMGCSQQNVAFWLKKGYCPIERVIEIEQATGVPRARLVSPLLLDLLTPLPVAADIKLQLAVQSLRADPYQTPSANIFVLLDFVEKHIEATTKRCTL